MVQELDVAYEGAGVYRMQFKAPAEPGTYRVSVNVARAGTVEDFFVAVPPEEVLVAGGGLSARFGPEPTAPGSGVVPDLRVSFEYNSFDLTPKARAQLDELGQALQMDALRSFKFQVAGHTDGGPEEYNERLSEQRAMAVASYLWGQHRVERGRLTVVGFGARELLDPSDPESAVNRRVVIRTLDEPYLGAPAELGRDTSALPPISGEGTSPALDCPYGPVFAPGCTLAMQVLSVLDASAVAPPIVTLNRPDGVYLDEDKFVAKVTMPGELSGYLYLDLITDSGVVYHLLPEPLREDNALPAGGEIRVGVEEEELQGGVRYWEVGDPFGEGGSYLLATVSENRLYEGLRPIEEPIAEYREVLLEALLDPATGLKAVRVERLKFRPRGG